MINYLLNQLESLRVATRRLFYAKGATLMMFIIIGITMCLPMSALLLLENVKQASSQIEYQAEVSVFLIDEYTKEELIEFEKFLKEQPIINKSNFEKKEEAWLKLQKKLAFDGKTLIEKNPLPDSFYLSLSTLDQNEINFLTKEIQNFSIIQDILIDSAWVNKLNSILNLIQLIVNFLGLLLLIVLAVIIGNTIRLQTLSNKDEIEVSKLIGASNAFIRRPFLYTGFFYGLGGALVSTAIIKLMVFVFNLYAYAIERILGFNVILNDLQMTHYFLMTISCIAIGWIASFFSSTRSLYKLKNNS
jgi:cell division transport system permease protein